MTRTGGLRTLPGRAAGTQECNQALGCPGQTAESPGHHHIYQRCLCNVFLFSDTCAMGNGSDAVVNAKLQVYGVEGLRIADASIMPRITTGYTNAPTLMIGEFAAQLMLGMR